MTFPESGWIKYIRALSAINETAAKKFTAYLNTHDVSTKAGRKAAIDYAYAVATQYGEMSAAAACEMYDAVAEASGVTLAAAVPAQTAEYGEVAKAVNGLKKQMMSNEVIGEAIGRLVKRAGADTTLKNAIRDGAEFAWIPHGDTCSFCLTIASNGWRKASNKVLKGDHAEHIHANCDCTFAIRFDSNSNVEGYDPDKYLEMYENADGKTWQEKVNSMRREQYAKDPEKYRAQKRESYDRRKALLEDATGDIIHNSNGNSDHNIFRNEDLPNGLPLEGDPNSISDKVDDDGKVLQRRIYDSNGLAITDFDTTDHGRPDVHKTGAHKHTFDYNKKKPRRDGEPLTEQELSDNSDIIRKGVNYHDEK